MTYEEFKKELYRNLKMQDLSNKMQVMLFEKGCIFTGEEEGAVVRMINFANSKREDMVVKEDIICAVWKQKGIVSMIHWSVRPIYECFKKEGWQGVLPQMFVKIQRSGKISNNLSIEEYATESGRLIIRLLCYSEHCEELEGGIYWKFGDIALVLYLLVHDSEEEYFTIKINRSMVDKWGLTNEVLLTNALLNSYAKMPPRLYYGSDIRSDYEKDYGVFMPGEKGRRIIIHPGNEREGLQGYRLTTTKRVNGAVALFYPGVQERLAKLLEGDYYVGFTSTHEAMIYPARHKVLSGLKKAIYDTNIMFERDEMLTNRVYRYNCSRKGLIEV